MQKDKTLLQEALDVVSERREAYGPPTQNMQDIANLWSVFLGKAITPQQVAICMILVKIARHKHQPKFDNLLDIAGYADVANVASEITQ